MEQLNVSFDMAEAKLSITKETKSTIPSVTLLATTPMLSHPPPPPYRVDALAHKNRRLSPPYQIPSAYSFIITLDLLAISALFGFPQPKYPNNLTQLSPTTSMRNPNNSGMASSGSSAEPSSDDLENFEGTANANVLRLLKLKTHECKELNALLLEANSERWRLDRQVKLNDADIRLAKQTNNSLHADCLRFDDRLQDLQRLEPKLDCANAEIQSLKESLADAHKQAQLREEQFEKEEAAWGSERDKLQTRIRSLADQLADARRETMTSSLPATPVPWVDRHSLHLPQIPPEVKKELMDLRALVPGYVETLDLMEYTIQNLNVELEDLHQAYNEVVDTSYGHQATIEDLTEQLMEAGNQQVPISNHQVPIEPDNSITAPESLAAEIIHASPKRPSTSSSASETKLLKLRRLNDSSRKSGGGEVEDLRQTNAQLKDYLDRLLTRIIGLEAFEHVLNIDFEAIRNGNSSKQAPRATQQPPAIRARRTASSSLAARTLRHLQVAKTKLLDKLNQSASSGVQALAKPFTAANSATPTPSTSTNHRPKNSTDRFGTFVKMLPVSTSQLGSVEYPPNTSYGKK
ncbi:hypothetical protein PSTG_05747 [Puccinia striiformis f. sp. tritici PST-78]|uniref:Uncharacterized protein n=1 Tax=Puccinia striiformis f. sp. tritici PST-78 TaxID=1165861 RepID=A0A0L0VPB5_9BASI|nr:hypothetical protein PSTG_05747 [Puccinia striiformis f. sp. tritici PST-78]